MKTYTKEKLKFILILIPFIILILYSFYVHKNEPHWKRTIYVKIIK